MEGIQITSVPVVGPSHPSFGASRAWYMFGMFSPDGMRRALLVEAENVYAVNMLESLAARGGAVSATCALLSVSESKPQVRSEAIEEVSFVDFVLDLVDADRWLGSPFMVEIFQKSLSEVDRVLATMKMEAAIRRRNWEQRRAEAAALEEEDEEEGSADEAELDSDADKLESLRFGLAGLGFQKRDVAAFVDSVKGRTEPVESLLVEGLRKLSKGAS